jgi:hypothetical protein
VTGSENLVLALCGGLGVDTTISGTNVSKIFYDPTLVGTGPRTLAYDFAGGVATAKTNQAKSAYLSSVADLSTNSIYNDPVNHGHFKDGAGEANDSVIPEFVDRFANPMPILYLRARVGAANTTTLAGGAVVIGDQNNVRNSANGATTGTVAQYDIAQCFGYTGSFQNTWPTLTAAPLNANELLTGAGTSIGEGKDVEYWYGPLGGAAAGPFSIDAEAAAGRGAHHGLFSLRPSALGQVGDPAAEYPMPAAAYFQNPAFGSGAAAQPRAKDSYILISAGPDRVFGTADDITSFGSVLP